MNKWGRITQTQAPIRNQEVEEEKRARWEIKHKSKEKGIYRKRCVHTQDRHFAQSQHSLENTLLSQQLYSHLCNSASSLACKCPSRLQKHGLQSHLIIQSNKYGISDQVSTVKRREPLFDDMACVVRTSYMVTQSEVCPCCWSILPLEASGGSVHSRRRWCVPACS